MESVSEGGRSWVLISLEGGVSSPNLDATEGCKHNSATVSHLEYYYPKYSHDPRFNLNKYLSNRIKCYQGIQVEVTEGARNLCRRLVKK
jgi:hypothetical protein